MGQYDSWDYLTNFIKKNRDTFAEELSQAPYAVKVKPHPERANLFMFKYSQFESDFTNPVVRCCRGSVYYLGEDGTVKPYLMPFFKFSNYGENGADPIDWNHTLYVRDKLDGSLIKLLKEPDGNDLWTTNGSFDIGVEVPELFPAETDEKIPPPHTFASLRDYALRGHEKEIARLPPLWTFMFELTSPYNKIIVPYRETKLILLGCRDPQGMEHTPEWAAENFGLSFATPKIYPLKNIDEVIAYCKSVDTNDREGVVVQDGNFNRIKIKTDHYRSLFFLKGEDHFSDERIFMAIKQESIDDALAAWHEIRPRTDEIIAEWLGFRNSVAQLCEKAAAYYRQCQQDCADNPKEAKKRFAMFVLSQYKPLSTFLFEAVKEVPDLESIYKKIEYKELKNFWIPAVEGAQ
ncbi:MAG: hypothetical protein LBI06_05910 [Treponema sp.]|jgi:hypothetical protein|nr:hypothetical protein [Treponema sp.]